MRDFWEWHEEDLQAQRTIKQEFDCRYCRYKPEDDTYLCQYDDQYEIECSHFEEVVPKKEEDESII